MTTIAYDGKTVAADSACTENYGRPIRKLFKTKEYILGGAGELAEILRARDYLKREGVGEIEDMHSEIELLLVSRETGNCWIWEQGYPIKQKAPMAIGSGAQGAMVAMERFGKSARQAVVAVSGIDQDTNRKVHSHRVRRNARS